MQPWWLRYVRGSTVTFSAKKSSSGPEVLQRNKSWLKFEHSPLTDSCKYVVLADVSGFYESVDHRRLAERLIRATGKRAEVEALSHFLTRVMGGSCGLPQGLEDGVPLTVEGGGSGESPC